MSSFLKKKEPGDRCGKKTFGNLCLARPKIPGRTTVYGFNVSDIGQDLSIGYLSHSAETVELYLQESFTFRVLTTEAAVALGVA